MQEIKDRIASLKDTADIVPEETQEILFPEIDEGSEYLVSLFYSAGTATQTGMGLIPLSWQEIEAWCRCNFMKLSPWELQVIKKLSDAYVNEYHLAADPKRKPPYKKEVEEVSEEDRKIIGNKVINILSQFRKRE